MPLYYGIVLPLDKALQIVTNKIMGPNATIGDYIIQMLDLIHVLDMYKPEELFEMEHDTVNF